MKGVRDKKNVEHLKKPLVTCRDFNRVPLPNYRTQKTT